MPHIVIEYSNSLRRHSNAVMRACHKHLSNCGICDPQAVKARCIPYEKTLLPEGARNFMHITVSLLEGRSEEERVALSQALFALVKEAVEPVDRLSVDIQEMAIATYSK